jgi:predicted HTH domain antitoxin
MENTLVSPSDAIKENVQMQWDHLSKNTACALITELYRADRITFGQARILLNCSSWQEAANILENHGCDLYYDRDDFEDDLESLETVGWGSTPPFLTA